jgi:hypothetical protein
VASSGGRSNRREPTTPQMTEAEKELSVVQRRERRYVVARHLGLVPPLGSSFTWRPSGLA